MAGREVCEFGEFKLDAPERLLSHVRGISLGDGAEHFHAQPECSFVDQRTDATGSTEA